MIDKLLKLANTLDDKGHYRAASYVDRIVQNAFQLSNQYGLGQKGVEMGGNVDQEGEAAEELNDEMEALEMDGFTPGTDNTVIDKNDNPSDPG